MRNLIRGRERPCDARCIGTAGQVSAFRERAGRHVDIDFRDFYNRARHDHTRGLVDLHIDSLSNRDPINVRLINDRHGDRAMGITDQA